MADPLVRALILDRPLPSTLSIDSVRQAARNGLGPMLLAATRDHPSVLPEQSARRLARFDLQSQARHLMHKQALRLLRSETMLADVELFVFKGIWNALALYGDANVRPSSDLDISFAHWPIEHRRTILTRLGVGASQIDALDHLDAAGRPLHELAVAVDVPSPMNVDFHMNPFGLVGATRLNVASDHSMRIEVPHVGEILGPTPELGLLIALVNLSRKGGTYLIGAADAVRLICGGPADIDWRHFESIAAEDGLRHLAQQALWALFEDLDWYPPCEVTRPRRRARWTAELGCARSAWSLPTMPQLLRRSQLRPRHVAEFLRWYVPSPTALEARYGDAGATSLARLRYGAGRMVTRRRTKAARAKLPVAATPPDANDQGWQGDGGSMDRNHPTTGVDPGRVQ